MIFSAAILFDLWKGTPEKKKKIFRFEGGKFFPCFCVMFFGGLLGFFCKWGGGTILGGGSFFKFFAPQCHRI